MGPTPSVEAFLRQLPAGLASYPDHQVKMSVVRSWIDPHDEAALRAALPAELDVARFLEQRVTAWVSEVQATVLYLTTRDLFFDDDAACVEAAFEKNRALLGNALYRTLSRLLSPSRLSKTGAMVFGLMHRGIVFEPVEVPAGTGVRLVFPPHLVPPLIVRCYATALQAALWHGGRRWTDVRLLERTETSALFSVARQFGD